MKVLSFGSLNIDYTYSVDHFVMAGETESSDSLEVFPGGKGLNQAIALSKAGLEVIHAGSIGEDGMFLRDLLQENHVDTSLLQIRKDIRTGNAIIQKNKEGNNCILLYGGANQAIGKEYIDDVLANFQHGNYLFIQNEINNLEYLVHQAYQKGLNIVMNPSPFNTKITDSMLSKITYLVLNEIEAMQITQINTNDYDMLAKALLEKLPNCHIVLTLGKDGCIYLDSSIMIKQPALKVEVVDTTAAGDTFAGYFFASLLSNYSKVEALKYATKAASKAITRKGAALSIPSKEEVY